MRIWNQVKLWFSKLWTQFKQLHPEAWNIQSFNGVWARDLKMSVQRSNQLNPWSQIWWEMVIHGFKCSCDEWTNERIDIYEMNRVLKPLEWLQGRILETCDSATLKENS